MIAQWENECISVIVVSPTRVQFRAVAQYFSLADSTMPTTFY